MNESFDIYKEPDNHFRTAILAVFLSVLPASAKADVPECHDIGSRPTPARSVRLDNNEEANVVCVVDGDTFDVLLKNGRTIRIRLWGVDCPESRKNEKCKRNGECREEIQRGKQAKELTKRLLDGKRVVLQGPFANIKNRKQAYVRVKGKDLGETLIGSCQCHEGYRHKRKGEYRKRAESCR